MTVDYTVGNRQLCSSFTTPYQCQAYEAYGRTLCVWRLGAVLQKSRSTCSQGNLLIGSHNQKTFAECDQLCLSSTDCFTFSYGRIEGENAYECKLWKKGCSPVGLDYSKGYENEVDLFYWEKVDKEIPEKTIAQYDHIDSLQQCLDICFSD